MTTTQIFSISLCKESQYNVRYNSQDNFQYNVFHVNRAPAPLSHPSACLSPRPPTAAINSRRGINGISRQTIWIKQLVGEGEQRTLERP